MDLRGKLPYWLCSVLLVAFAVGCQMQVEPVASQRRPSVKQDPCADQLHELSGRLLLHHNENKRLPQSLDELADGAPALCPASGLPYVYSRRGVAVPGHSGLLIAHDATACHSGMRWAILADTLGGRSVFTVRVILLSEQAFQSAVSVRQPGSE